MGEVTYTDFAFKTRPYSHQHDCWRVSRDKDFYGLFLDMGCGKSKIILDTAGYLALNKKIDATVILAPKGVYRNWYDGEVPTHFTDVVDYRMAYWSSSANKEERKSMGRLLEPGSFHRIFLVNIEAMASKRAVEELTEFLKKYRCLMVIDESTMIKNPDAKRTKILINIGQYAKYRRICTGNPIPNGPLDLYSQSEFLKKGITGYSNYFAFRNRFAIMQDQSSGGKTFKHVTGYKDLDHLKALMGKFAFIIKKADCLDLPQKIYQTIDVEMNATQIKAYNDMVADSLIKITESAQVSAQIVMTQLLRLHQISCGFMKPDYMDPIGFGEPNERMSALLSVLEQAPGKVIIWANYRYNIQEIMLHVSEKFGKDSIVHYYGATSDDERQFAKRHFQDPNSPVRFIVSNPDTGRFGNTWTQATTVVYYSNSYNLESRDQSEDRAHRIGQTGAVNDMVTDAALKDTLCVLYIDLRVRGTVDDKIIKVLKAKKKLTDDIVQSNWRWLIEDKIVA